VGKQVQCDAHPWRQCSTCQAARGCHTWHPFIAVHAAQSLSHLLHSHAQLATHFRPTNTHPPHCLSSHSPLTPPSQRDLESIRSHLLQRKGALVNLTGDDRALSAATAHVNDLLSRLPETAASSSNGSSSSWQQQGLLPRINEALVVPTQVRHVRRRGIEPATSRVALRLQQHV
jgi:hypothetical protein